MRAGGQAQRAGCSCLVDNELRHILRIKEADPPAALASQAQAQRKWNRIEIGAKRSNGAGVARVRVRPGARVPAYRRT